MKSVPAQSKHSKLILFLLIIIILGPIIFAWMLYHKGNHQQLRLSNEGDLISSPPNISSSNFFDLSKKESFTGAILKGKWWLVYVGPDKCYQECENTLYNLRQVRLALGKNTERVDRLFIPHPDCAVNVCEQFLNEFYPDMRRAKMDQVEFNHLFKPISNPIDREMVGEIYIVDPHGNVMMHYSAESEANAILSDLKRLLKVSKIG
ncbi:MAG: SCO family protein [Candidatus Berkiellales bacterium]